jgi:predicted NAD/FAD-binding protein
MAPVRIRDRFVLKVAVIGAGITGVSAAWHLDQGGMRVHLIEAGLRIGGQAHTHLISVKEGSVTVDTGFSVSNPVGYPGFHHWLNGFDLELNAARMDVSVQDQVEDLEFGTVSLAAMTGKVGQLFRSGYWRIWQDRTRLFAELDALQGTGQSLGDYIQGKRYSRRFVQSYLLPLISAFQGYTGSAFDMPLSDALNYLRYQKLLHYRGGRDWQVVQGGSSAYLQAFEKQFSGVIHTNSMASDISRDGRQVNLIRDGLAETYDAVVLACDSDQALHMLADTSSEQRTVLAQATPRRSDAFLHGDQSFMPRNRTCWASRNVTREKSGHHSVTYWINRIQGLTCSEQFFLTVNPSREPQRVRWQGSYMLPHAGQSAQALQRRWSEVSTQDICFAGAYSGYGTHEDGFITGLHCAEHLLHMAVSRTDAKGRASAA